MAACGFTHFDSPNLWISNLEVHILSLNPEQKVGFLAPKPWPNASFLKDLTSAYMSSFQLHLNPQNLKSSCERLGGYRLPSVEPASWTFFVGVGRPCFVCFPNDVSLYTNGRFAVSKILLLSVELNFFSGSCQNHPILTGFYYKVQFPTSQFPRRLSASNHVESNLKSSKSSRASKT